MYKIIEQIKPYFFLFKGNWWKFKFRFKNTDNGIFNKILEKNARKCYKVQVNNQH